MLDATFQVCAPRPAIDALDQRALSVLIQEPIVIVQTVYPRDPVHPAFLNAVVEVFRQRQHRGGSVGFEHAQLTIGHHLFYSIVT